MVKLFDVARKLLALPDPPLEGVQLPSEMAKVLQRERARADRLGDPFSLLAFQAHEQAAGRTWAPLARVLASRLRTTDEVGWLPNGALGVVLPATGVDGAWKVARDVLAELPADLPAPTVTVYGYPTEGYKGEEPVQSAEAGLPAGFRVAALEALFLLPMPLWKRALDVIGAGVGLVLLFPLLLLIAVAVKLTSRGPVLFCQRRSGLGGRPFVMYKFRTMVPDAEARKKELLARNEQDGPAFKLRHDPRVTRLGRFLRQTSLDELPQLWNVLVGDMTLVGPRPLPCAESEACAGWQRGRLDVTPGLTCIWQVSGRSRVSFADWVRMDVRYIRSRSLRQDLQLLLLTVPAVLLRRGV